MLSTDGFLTVENVMQGRAGGAVRMTALYGRHLRLPQRPKGYVYKQAWPDPVPNPGWASSSELCVSTASKIRIEIGDETQSYAVDIDPDLLPQSARGLTLVMCKKNKFMTGQHGMNIGGISALFSLIMVDYGGSRVGFKTKNLGTDVVC